MYAKKDAPLLHLVSILFISLPLTLLSLLSSLEGIRVECCDLEEYFSEKQVSVEESARDSTLLFRGLSTNAAAAVAAADAAAAAAAFETPQHSGRNNNISPRGDNSYTAYFELISIYKGVESLRIYDNNRQVNVTILSRPSSNVDCDAKVDIPREYIVFCRVQEGHLRAVSIAKWDDETDERVWNALGWGAWTEWSSCSVSCSAGIQQRTRHCLLQQSCPGFNIEQRHCNLFACKNTINPLSIEEGRYYHPSKSHWQRVPDRQNAWRLRPDNYIWLPSSEILNPLNAALGSSRNNASNLSSSTTTTRARKVFPKEFSLFLTLRLINVTTFF